MDGNGDDLGMSSLTDDEKRRIEIIGAYMDLDDLPDHVFTSQEVDDWATKELSGLLRENINARPDGVPAVVTSEKPKKKAVNWTTEEHKLFLLGLERLGRSRWTLMSKIYVPTKTPIEIASHAQKYYLRASSTQRKRRNSVNDAVLSAEDRIKLMAGVVRRLGAQEYMAQATICPLQGFTAPAPQPLIPQARMFQSHTHLGQAQAMPAPRMTPYFPMNGYNGANIWM